MSSPLCTTLLNLVKANAELKRDLNRSYWSDDVIRLFYRSCEEIIESKNQEEIETLEYMEKRLRQENERLQHEV